MDVSSLVTCYNDTLTALLDKHAPFADVKPRAHVNAHASLPRQKLVVSNAFIDMTTALQTATYYDAFGVNNMLTIGLKRLRQMLMMPRLCGQKLTYC